MNKARDIQITYFKASGKYGYAGVIEGYNGDGFSLREHVKNLHIAGKLPGLTSGTWNEGSIVCEDPEYCPMLIDLRNEKIGTVFEELKPFLESEQQTTDFAETDKNVQYIVDVTVNRLSLREARALAQARGILLENVVFAMRVSMKMREFLKFRMEAGQ